MSSATDLASAAGTIEEVISRVVEAAAELDGGPAEHLTPSLHEVERLLLNATRRLRRVVSELA